MRAFFTCTHIICWARASALSLSCVHLHKSPHCTHNTHTHTQIGTRQFNAAAHGQTKQMRARVRHHVRHVTQTHERFANVYTNANMCCPNTYQVPDVGLYWHNVRQCNAPMLQHHKPAATNPATHNSPVACCTEHVRHVRFSPSGRSAFVWLRLDCLLGFVNRSILQALAPQILQHISVNMRGLRDMHCADMCGFTCGGDWV